MGAAEQVKVHRYFKRIFWIALLVGALWVGLPGARPRPDDTNFRTLGHARDVLFDFAGWEARALADKAVHAALRPERYLSENERTQIVRDYLALVGEIQRLEREVQDIYLQPDIDHEAASAALRAERDRLRAEQQAQQALAESLRQSQVAEVLAEYGFGVGGQIIPPVVIRFTALPTMLIISPRDHIERIGSYPLEHGLTVDDMEVVEAQVEDDQDVSALITPIGGLAVWPAMLVETSYLPSAYEVTAHEWTHHYLAMFPLGFNYAASRETITINETVASIVGREIEWAVLNRYYPDLAIEPPNYAPVPEPEPQPNPVPDEPPAFDFRAEMRETRVRVDEMLAAGQIEEAEAYMEARRLVFVENGYRIRKLNQAYFAFYGSYADEPGATGADPIGPALRELRYTSASLKDFIVAVRGMTSLAEIQAELDARRPAEAAAAR